MQTSRYSDGRIISILKQAEAGTAVPGLCRVPQARHEQRQF